jgi:predicted nucleotide-binding protein (sugar kinase/HSP70/actin superfamily)
MESFFGKWRGVLGSHTGAMTDLLEEAQQAFMQVPVRDEKRPLVGVIGEFYVRIHDGANQGIVRQIERNGGEAWLAPLTEFFSYSNQIGAILSKERWHDTWDRQHLKASIYHWAQDRLAVGHEHKLYHATLPLTEGRDDITAREVVQLGERYVHHTFGGEAICSMGKAEDLANRGLSGIVSVIPFNCMPGNVVTSLSHTLRKNHHNLPFLNLDYDGFVDNSRNAKIVSFMWQVKERFSCNGHGNGSAPRAAVSHK